MEIEWHEANKNAEGIKTIAYKPINKQINHWAIVGYNGILKGDKVEYEGKEYTIVMVSRLGDFGLSETGELPYMLRVSPTKVKIK